MYMQIRKKDDIGEIGGTFSSTLRIVDEKFKEIRV